MLARPIGSTATIASPQSAVATVSPDKHGWYRVQLSINTGQARLGEVHTLAFCVPDTADQAAPAAGSKGNELNYLVGGVPNPDGWAHETNSGQFFAIDNRHNPLIVNINAGLTADITIPWGKPDALLQMVGVFSNGTSGIAEVKFYRDAARTEVIAEFGPFDPSGPAFLFNRATMLTGATATLENKTIYARLFNNDIVNGTFTVSWRFRTV